LLDSEPQSLKQDLLLEEMDAMKAPMRFPAPKKA